MNKFTKTDYFDFIKKTQADMLALIEKKNQDYTAGDQETDPFRNFREATDFGIDPIAGLCNRMSDKFNRIKAFVKTGELAVTGAGDGFEDAFKDMIGYSLLALGMLAEQKRQPDPDDDRQLEFDFAKAVAAVEDEHCGWYLLGPDEPLKEGDEVRWKGQRDDWEPAAGLVGQTCAEPAYDAGHRWEARRFVKRDDNVKNENIKVRRKIEGAQA